MFSIFLPRYVKEGRHYRHALKRLIHYKEDTLSPDDLAHLRGLQAELEAALKARQREQVLAAQAKIDAAIGRVSPLPKDAAWRENAEVIIVAIVVAAGVRAYFLQPFKIPTGSMQPTLFGVVGEVTNTPPPNPLVRAFDFLWLGRSYLNVIAKDNETVVDLQEFTWANFFTFTDIFTQTDSGGKNRYRVFAPRATVMYYLHVFPELKLRKGEYFIRGYVDTGDQVFVDKFSYQWTPPSRGDVFVFKTIGIFEIQKNLPRGVDSEHYIKRLAGLPGDILRIDPPRLFLNDKLDEIPPFRRVMSEKDGYRGYSNMDPFLASPSQSFTVPAHCYFALGDNSYNSLDSRAWGVVPQRNIAGRGLFVYWPFSKRWGLIH